MCTKTPRLAVRALIVDDDRLLLVNAYSDPKSTLWCAPGGGVISGSSLPDNLAREVWEETGLRISVGDPVGVNEFHNPLDGFHQVELFFRASIISGTLDDTWKDTEKIVTRRRFFTRDELTNIRFKPDSLTTMAFDPQNSIRYDPLERIVR